MKKILFLFCLLPLSLLSQNSWEFEIGRGFVIPHRAVMQKLQQGHSNRLAIAFLKDQQNTDWGSRFNFIKTGLSLHYIGFGNDRELGQAIGLQYQLSLGLSAAKNRLRFTIGYGPGLLNRHYQEGNEKNIAIGSTLNASMFLALRKAWNVRKHQVGLALSISHFSNASFSAPNLGLNIPFINLGFYPGAATTEFSARVKQEISQPSAFQASFDFGFKQVSIAKDKRYFTGTSMFLYRPKSKSISQLDLFSTVGLNQSIPAAINQEVDIITGERQSASNLAALQVGLGFGYRVHFGNSALFIHQGYYLFSEQAGIGKLFHRIGLSQSLNDKVSVNLILKTHFAKAEYLGIGMGYNLYTR